MDWMPILQQVFELCIVPLLGLATTYLIQFLKAKRDQAVEKSDSEVADKYINMLYETVEACVKATSQTYVDTLKKNGAFTAESQKEAFNLTLTAVKSILSDEAQDYLTNIYGDLNSYIGTLIEAKVKENKN